LADASETPRAFIGGARSDGLHFRPVEPADREFLGELYWDVRREELAPVAWPDQAKRDFVSQQYDLQHAHYVKNYPGADLLLIAHGGESIGRVYVYRSAREIRLMDIALAPGWRNRGIGTRLIQELIAEATARRHALTLHVEPNNPAQRLYRRFGFRLIEQRGVYDFLGLDPPAV